MNGRPGFTPSIHEEDLKRAPNGTMRARYVAVGFGGTTFRVPAHPGKRPPHRMGESPLDPPAAE